MFIWSKRSQNPSQIDVRAFARVKNLIWDQLLATEAEIIQSQAVFSWLCKTEGDFVIWNFCFCLLSRSPKLMVLRPALAMECRTVINKIVFTSPEAMVEFSGEKNNISALVKNQPLGTRLVKNPFNLCKFIFVWKVNKKTSSLSPITNHAKTLCKECETKSLTIQALGQLWITQSLLFPGNVYSPNVVAKYYVMFLWEQELKERGFKFFKLLVKNALHCLM